MFFKKKKNYTIKPNFVSPGEDVELLMVALISMVTQDDYHKTAFIAGTICHWVFDEDNKRFLPKEEGLKWLSGRISSGDGESLAMEIKQAIETSMEDDKDRAIRQLFNLQ